MYRTQSFTLGHHRFGTQLFICSLYNIAYSQNFTQTDNGDELLNQLFFFCRQLSEL